MTQRFEPVLRALNDAAVRYLVVGGVAVVLHGYLRTTPAERLVWLEEMLDELLPLVGRARAVGPTVEKGRS